MWAVLEICVIAALILIAITEFFIPILFNKPLFGSFRKKDKKPVEVNNDELPGKILKTKAEVRDVQAKVREVKEEADENYRTAEQLKEESDNLLK